MHLGLGARDLRAVRRVRQQRGEQDRLRHLQEPASAGPQAGAARHRRHLHRGQAVPEDQQLHRRRTPAAGGQRRILRKDQGRQGRAARRAPLDCRAGRGADRRMGHGRGAALRRALSPSRGRRDPDPLQTVVARRDPHVRACVGRPRSAGDRAHQVLQHADRRVPQGRHRPRNLGQPPDPCGRVGDAGGRAGDPRQPDAGRGRGPHRAGRRDLPAAGCRRVFSGRRDLPVGRAHVGFGGGPRGQPRRGPQGGH